ncbi:hypothetical protein GCM10029976_028850 [Kribbella albertanoniae]|uniref:Anti-sigma factor n=1 Tax=Kribbella albertanoniae TaxID=1266829 RepID=A0A4V2XNP4_9ACTN|nr:anti-sigma factor [Kribbella albertanoniae]TDC18696.1 anti-sigma factor [Kribbella albertanoniae]
MTRHLDDDVLAQWALEDDGPDGPGTDHLQSCPQCAATLAELKLVLANARSKPRLDSPPPELWTKISDELSLDPGQSDVAPSAPVTGPDEPVARRSPARRFGGRALAAAAAFAAVAGAGAGVGGTVLLGDDEPAAIVQAAIKLEPLEGKTGAGTADLLQAAAGGQLKVSASGLSAVQGFYEVWMINTDGKRMVSLGVLNPGSGGTFQIPGEILAQGYRIVDVSLEPDDGNPVHSRNSIIRGILPS